MSQPKPHLFVVATAVYGHVAPLRAVARALISRGYEVTFATGTEFKTAIESIGAHFVPFSGNAEFTQAKHLELGAIARKSKELGEGPGALHAHLFIDPIPDQWQAIQTGMKKIQQREPGRQVMMLVEGCCKGAVPGMLKVSGSIQPVGYVGIGIVPIELASKDTAPFGACLPPDSSPEGQARNIKLNTHDREVVLGQAQKAYEKALNECAVVGSPPCHYRDATFLLADRFVQMCAPSFEYPRSDAPATLQFAGGLPSGMRDPMTEFPEWWDDVAKNPEKRKIVFVSQGTVSPNQDDLVVPTMQAFQDRKDILVVVALGAKGMKMPVDVQVPENSRIADFLPYDETLQFTDVFVTNGGYGACQHGLSNGVPLIIAGVVADKPENAVRVEWSGVGLNLRTDTPSPEQVRQAVDEILGNEKFKRRAMEIRAEMESFDPIGVVIDNINAVIAERTGMDRL